MQFVFQMQQLFPLALHQPGDGNAGPAADNPGDFLLGDLVPQEAVFPAAFLGDGLLLFQLLFQLRQLTVFQLRGPVQVVAAFRLLDLSVDTLDFLPQAGDLADGLFFRLPAGFHGVEGVPLLRQFLLHFSQMYPGQGVLLFLQGGFLNFQLHDMAADIVQLRGQGIDFRADQGTGLIHQVDGLIRQEPVGDIAVGEGRRSDQGRVLNFDTVENLIPLLESPQDRDGILHRRFGDHYRLEPPLQGGILFNILAVFVQGGGADAVQLTPGQHRFEQVAGIHGAVGLAGAHNGMQFIDKQQNPAFAFPDFLQNGLQAFLKFTAEFRTGDQTAHIQGKNGFVLQALRHVSPDNPEGQAFGNGGFADAGFTDEHRVVLRLAGEDPDHVPDFRIPPDDRIQLLPARQLHQVGSVFFQGIVGILRAVGSYPGGSPHLLQRFQESLRGIAEGLQQAAYRGGSLRAQADPQMLHRQVFILHLFGGFFCLQQGFFDIGGIAGLACAGTGNAGHAVQSVLQTPAEGIHRNAAAGEQLRNQILGVFGQGGHQVLLLHIHVSVFHGKRLGALKRRQGLLRQLIHIHI